MSTENVVSIAVAERRPDPEMVDMMEKYLELAKSGDLLGVAICTLRPGDVSTTEFCCVDKTPRVHLLGAATMLYMRLADRI